MIAGPPGAGKTITGVKLANKIIRQVRFWWWWQYSFKLKIMNRHRKRYNIKQEKKMLRKKEKGINYVAKQKEYLIPIAKPMIYSTIPVHFKQHWWTRKDKREWSCQLKLSHLLLLEEMSQNNVALLDEMPQYINQYNWDLPEVQMYFNEYATFHRHYYNNVNIITAQAPADIVVQLRRKINHTTLMLFFHKVPILPIYKAQCLDIMTNELVSTMSSTLIEDNTRTYWGLMPPKDTYDSRCFSNRINNIYIKLKKGKKQDRWDNLKTNTLMRFDKEAKSTLDDGTTEQQQESIYNQYRKYLNANKKEQDTKPKMTLDLLAEIVADELSITKEQALTKLEEKKQQIIERNKQNETR